MRDTDPAMNLDFWLSSGAAHVWNPARAGAAADWERQIDQLMLKNASTFDRIERLQAFVGDAQNFTSSTCRRFFSARRTSASSTSMRVLNATPSPLRPHLLWNAESLAALEIGNERERQRRNVATPTCPEPEHEHPGDEAGLHPCHFDAQLGHLDPQQSRLLGKPAFESIAALSSTSFFHSCKCEIDR